MKKSGRPELPSFVFVHGMIGFGAQKFGGYKLEYFRALRSLFGDLGIQAVFPRVSNLASIETRARDLAAALETTSSSALVVVGASMGGLDARYFTSRLDKDRRVRALVSVGTPHRGSPIADKTMTGKGPISRLGRVLGGSAVMALTTQACARFNTEVPDRPDVRYLSYAGQRSEDELPLWLRSHGRYVSRREGHNDGLVSVASATWGQFRGCLRADHFELIGWNLGRNDRGTARPFDHRAFYKELVCDVLAAVRDPASP